MSPSCNIDRDASRHRNCHSVFITSFFSDVGQRISDRIHHGVCCEAAPLVFLSPPPSGVFDAMEMPKEVVNRSICRVFYRWFSFD